MPGSIVEVRVEGGAMAILLLFLGVLMSFAFCYAFGVVRRRSYADPKRGQRAARWVTGLGFAVTVGLTALVGRGGSGASGPAVDMNGAVDSVLWGLGAVASGGAGLAWICFLGPAPGGTASGEG